MEEAERQRRIHHQWLENQRSAAGEPHLRPSLSTAPHPPPLPSYVPPIVPTWNPPPVQAQSLPQHYRRRPPHPDEFYHPPAPQYLDYPYQSSPEISPLTQASYPPYPTPSTTYSRPSPSPSVGSTPSPFTTPGGTTLPLPPTNPYLGHAIDLSHGTMFNAVESARWMATLEGPGESALGGPSYRAPLPNSPHSAPEYLAPLSSVPPPPIPSVVPPDSIRRQSDESAASPTSSNSPFLFGRSDGIDDYSSTSSVKPFIEKLYGILSRPATYGDCMRWSDAGDSFFVAHSEKFVQEVLPEQFCHSNIHSFTRQLNVYSFTRMSVKQLRAGLSIPSATTSEYSGWSHPYFQRGDTSRLASLNPRPSRARLLKKLEKQYGTTSTSGSSGGGASASRGGGSGERRSSRSEVSSIDEHG
ncbi:hypothetical protein JCM11491_002131 [Sporobolomyces phaffii]